MGNKTKQYIGDWKSEKYKKIHVIFIYEKEFRLPKFGDDMLDCLVDNL